MLQAETLDSRLDVMAARRRLPSSAGWILATLLFLTGTMVVQSSAAADQAPDPWVFEAHLDIFVPTNVSGTETFPPGPSPPAGSGNVGANNGIVSVNGAFVGGFWARYERWGLYTYVIYLDLEGTRTGSDLINIAGHPLNIDTTTTARLVIRDSYALVAGTYRIVTDPAYSLDVLVGGRFFDQHRSLDWQLSGNVASIPLASRSGSRTVDQSGVDAILGLTGRFGPTGHGWFAPYYLDVGTGNSDLTWQANAGVGYGWHWGEVAAGWRYMHYQFSANRYIESLGLNGPVVAILFRW